MTDEATRKAFEEWARSRSYNCFRYSSGTYAFADIQRMYDAWLAATAHEREKVRELVEAVEAIPHSGYDDIKAAQNLAAKLKATQQ